jgi:hypothetical protein
VTAVEMHVDCRKTFIPRMSRQLTHKQSGAVDNRQRGEERTGGDPAPPLARLVTHDGGVACSPCNKEVPIELAELLGRQHLFEPTVG